MPKYNKHVAVGVAELFGKDERADCTIIFTVDNDDPNNHGNQGAEHSHEAGEHGARNGGAQREDAGSAASGRKRRAEDSEAGSGGNAAVDAAAAASPPAPRRVVGEPLPAHTLVLCLASERFKSQVERWSDEAAEAGPSSKRLAAAAATNSGGNREDGRHGKVQLPLPVPQPRQRPPLLELRVPLGGEEELSAALAAIKFAYTGHIEAGSIREALQVRRQADYLQMKGCVEACVAAAQDLLFPASGAAARRKWWQVATRSASFSDDSDSDDGGEGSDGSGHSRGHGRRRAANVASTTGRVQSVLELFTCTHLWPDPDQEPAFAALLAEAKPQLVAHFGDALAVLNKADLYEQMLALPAVGMEALLESHDFGTDSESSVVLMLAEWMDVNYGSTDLTTRRRLCGLLRLCQCSRAYTDWVLPALALDHLLHPDTQAGWLPITPQQAGVLRSHAATVSYGMQADLADVLSRLLGAAAAGSPPPVSWLAAGPRRSCLQGTSRGLFCFSVTQAKLVQAFGQLQPEAEGEPVCVSFASVPAARASGNVCVAGLELSLQIAHKGGEGAARMQVVPRLPHAFRHNGGDGDGSSLHGLRRPLKMPQQLEVRLRCKGPAAGGPSKTHFVPISLWYDHCLRLGDAYHDDWRPLPLGTAAAVATPAGERAQRTAASVGELWAPYLCNRHEVSGWLEVRRFYAARAVPPASSSEAESDGSDLLSTDGDTDTSSDGNDGDSGDDGDSGSDVDDLGSDDDMEDPDPALDRALRYQGGLLSSDEEDSDDLEDSEEDESEDDD